MCAGREFQVESADIEKAREEKLLVIPAGLVRRFVLAGASTPYKRWSKCTMQKIGGGGFCRNLGGEVCKLFMHFPPKFTLH